MGSYSAAKSSGFVSFSLSSFFCDESSSAVGIADFMSPETIPLSSELVLVWSVIIWPAKVFSVELPFCCAILAASISSMSLIAASLMKSSVFGAIPRVEFTPVFSAADCANATVERKTVLRAIMARERFMSGSLCCFGIDGRIGQFGQRVVGLLLFGERLVQELDRVLQVELCSPRLERAVTRNLIVLHGLRSGEQAGIERGLALVF